MLTGDVRVLPVLFMLIHADPAWPERYDEQQTPDDGERLEKVVLEEVSHRSVGGDVPPGIDVEVKDGEPEDEDEGGELGLVTDGDQDDEDGADEVLGDLERREVEAEQRHEHEDEHDATAELHVRLGLIGACVGNTSKHTLSLLP